MTLVIFDGNIKNYSLLNKKNDDHKIELIHVQETQTETEVTKKNKLTKENKKYINSLAKDLKKKVKLSKENREFLKILRS